MSRLRTPCTSFGAHGKLAKTLTFHRWKGVKQAQKYVKPRNPRTANQQANRERLKIADAFWVSWSTPETPKAGWQRLATAQRKKASGYNVYMSAALKALGITAEPVFAWRIQVAFGDGIRWHVQNIVTYSPGYEAGNWEVYAGINSPTLKLYVSKPLTVQGHMTVANIGAAGDVVLAQLVKDGIPRSGIDKFILT